MSQPSTGTIDRANIIQFIRYALVGVLNTVITFAVIYICKDFLGINPWVSNALGYIAGFVNSFIWNKVWVFRSDGAILKEAAKFFGGFMICYAIQFVATWVLAQHSFLTGNEWTLGQIVISGYGVATLIGMVAYTVANFVYNKVITFASARDPQIIIDEQ
ncbi:MAG: GtrA family protein [Pseudoflavonifractor sp.]|nr:GtrA family protein [Alloprevotella sp.]MCM1116047.1 GtrA family protein [Pseudoflavonifractor sp.]